MTQSWYESALSPALPSRRTVLWLCVLACVANVVLVGALAGAGVLKSTERGDIEYTDTETRPDGDIVVPSDADYRFAIESPTDADAFYNMVVRVWSGGPLYNTWQPDNVQEYHYLPVTYYFFAAISLFGYVAFKYLLFGLSLLATAGGTYLLLDAESSSVGFNLSRRALLGLSAASVGFAPMVANFKVGQVTPFAYLCTAVAWWAYRRSDDGLGGAALVVPTILKPYWMSPLAVFISPADRRWRGVVGFLAAFAAANALSVFAFGVETTAHYYAIVASEALAESGGLEPITEWSVEAIRPFPFLGGVAIVPRLLSVLPVAWVWARYVRGRSDYDVPLFALSIVMLFTLLQSTTLIDLGLALAAFVVLGVHCYRADGWPFALLGLSFLLAHAHTYAMEVLVGNGHPNLAGMLDGEPLLKLLQPAVYAVGLLYLLSLWLASERATAT
ncbi:glycosyltransferase family 87 protein [Halogeometricum sp. CBA1124]|uniref:glycosyltransferase family 87 protein n=1 Tax=Halogeometricum sp. CBA1124 TaxID=2668071 RepID=UPI001429863D|nr:glycosyltransferase family 87 protein [Halogeometricum sp. CBA1124]MUV58297.1 DUF2029 domain-containing protein [Halogeometricum sp. CBA1124]